MPRLSIVIASLNDAEPFELTLASVLQRRPDDCEVVVVHPFAYPDPYDLSAEVRFIHAAGRANCLELLNAGLAAARGDVVHFLEAGLEVEDGWAETALACFDQPAVGAVSPLVAFAGQGQPVIWNGIAYHAGGRRILVVSDRLSGSATTPRDVLGPARFAGFYRTRPLRELGGFDLGMGEQLADVDLALSLRQLGFRSVTEPASRIRATAMPNQPRPDFASGCQAEQLFWRHAPTQGWLTALLLHPLAVAAETISQLPNPTALAYLAGRVWGCFSLSGYKRYQRRVQGARTRLDESESAEDATATRPGMWSPTVRRQAA